jgi:hypothetical protein
MCNQDQLFILLKKFGVAIDHRRPQKNNKVLWLELFKQEVML